MLACWGYHGISWFCGHDRLDRVQGRVCWELLMLHWVGISGIPTFLQTTEGPKSATCQAYQTPSGERWFKDWIVLLEDQDSSIFIPVNLRWIFFGATKSKAANFAQIFTSHLDFNHFKLYVWLYVCMFFFGDVLPAKFKGLCPCTQPSAA